MGATTFGNIGEGKTAQAAFNALVEQARYEHGHGGYTGTIAEKSKFVMISLPAGREAEEYIDELIEKCDRRIDDKWGPAGCIALGNGRWYFFGWASQ